MRSETVRYLTRLRRSPFVFLSVQGRDHVASARPSPLSQLLSYPPLVALKPYWRVTIAAFLGWFLDAFDQTALLLTLPDISHEFGVTISAMGSVLLAQSIGRASAIRDGDGWQTVTGVA